MMATGTVPPVHNLCNDVCCLRAFRTLNNIKRHTLTFIEGFVTISLNRAEMYENIFPTFNFNKPETLF
ncbi:hypothetical protein ALPO108162_03570 [Alicyclobacillus pomorum]